MRLGAEMPPSWIGSNKLVMWKSPVAYECDDRDMGFMGPKQAEEKLGGKEAPLRFGVVALIAGNLFMSMGPMLVRMSDTGPVASAFWRIIIAAPLLFVVARLSGDPARKLSGPLFWLFLCSGLFFAADLAAWHIGILQTKMANATLLGNSTSFLLPIYGFVVARVLPTRIQGWALALAAGGMVLLLGRSFELSTTNLWGDLLCLLAGVFYTGYLVLLARAKDSMGPWPTLAWSTVMSIVPLFALSKVLGEQIIPTNWTPLIVLAICSQILGQGLIIYAIGRVSNMVVGLMMLIQPIVSAVIGWQLYREILTPFDAVGAVLIGLALLLVRQPDRREA
jgi:drug/metabolite transporter (DMT)-like permease